MLSIIRAASATGFNSNAASPKVAISLPRVSIAKPEASTTSLPMNCLDNSTIPKAAPNVCSSFKTPTCILPLSMFLISLASKNNSLRTLTLTLGSTIVVSISQAAALICFLEYLNPSTIASKSPRLLASSATPITAALDLPSIFRPLVLKDSVIRGAGSPLLVPFLIAVTSAMLRAT